MLPDPTSFHLALRDAASTLAPYTPGNERDAQRWIYLVGAYESAGFTFDFRTNAHGYGGRFQRGPIGGRPYLSLPGKMDLATQMRDAIAFWMAQVRDFEIPGFESLSDFYCLNLAPARVTAPHGVVYAHPGALTRDLDAGLAAEVAEAGRRWPRAYAAQDPALDPERKGFILRKDLGPVVEKGTRRLHAWIETQLDLVAALP